MKYKVINSSVMESQSFCGIFDTYDEARRMVVLLQSRSPQCTFEIKEILDGEFYGNSNLSYN